MRYGEHLVGNESLDSPVQKNTVRQRFRDKLATCCYIGGTGPYIPARLLPCWKHIRQGLQGCHGNLSNFYSGLFSISFLDTWWSRLIPYLSMFTSFIVSRVIRQGFKQVAVTTPMPLGSASPWRQHSRVRICAFCRMGEQTARHVVHGKECL